MNDKALHFSNQPKKIEVRGAKVHNLKNIDVDIPLYGITGIAGVSGSGKSSLALGVVYAEGSRRYYAEPGFRFYGAGFCALSLQ